MRTIPPPTQPRVQVQEADTAAGAEYVWQLQVLQCNGVCSARRSSTLRRRAPLPLDRRTHGGPMGWLLRTPGRGSKVLLCRSMLLVVWLLRD